MNGRKTLLGCYLLRWYPTLKQAGACDLRNTTRVESTQDPIYIWQKECITDRKRDYIVEEPRLFWEKYIRMKPAERTFYELIRPNDPWKFYLDLEFSKTVNPDVHGKSMMQMVRKYLKELLLR